MFVVSPSDPSVVIELSSDNIVVIASDSLTQTMRNAIDHDAPSFAKSIKKKVMRLAGNFNKHGVFT